MLLLIPVGMIFYRAFEHGAAAAWDSVTTPDALHAFYLTILITAIAVAPTRSSGSACALLLVRTSFAARRCSTRSSTCRSRSRRSSSASRCISSTAARAGSANVSARQRHPDPLRATGDDAGDDLRLPAVRGARGGARAARDRRRAGAGGADAGGQLVADLPANHAAGDPLGGRIRSRSDDGARPGRVRRGRHGLRPGQRIRRRPRRCGLAGVRAVQHDRGLHGFAGPGADRGVDPARDELFQKKGSA